MKKLQIISKEYKKLSLSSGKVDWFEKNNPTIALNML